MKSNKDIAFITKPKINTKELAYVLNSKKVYANLFEITMNKSATLYQYPYKVDPPIGDTDVLIRDKLFKRSSQLLYI